MARFTGLLLIVILAMGAVLWAVQSPNEITFQGPGFEGSTSRVALALIVIVASAVLAALWWGLVSIWDIPRRLARSARRLKTRRMHDAIADGLLAVEAEDAAAAQRAASRLEKAPPDAPGLRKLAFLLKARAYEADENWIEAERSYSDLARESGGELAGLRGLAAAALKRGDHKTASVHARSALAHKTHAAWPFRSLFEIQLKTADWSGAARTLEDGDKRGLIPTETARRMRAVLLTAEAERLRKSSTADAESLALEAAKLCPAFPPAAALAARLLTASGKAARAQAVIEAAWKARPHPALSIAWSNLRPKETQRDAARRMRTLADLNPAHRESRILFGEAAITEGDWLTAAEALAPLLEFGATSRLCTLMERVAHGQGSYDDERRWARVAASAPREPDWSDIDPERKSFRYSDEEWARLVRSYGDHEELIHTRHEAFGGELEALSRVALPAPTVRSVKPPPPPKPVPGRRRAGPQPTIGPLRPPAPDYAPEE
ncbi:heme biosynthesis protein HemY [bacterium]|nr:heme biosynthesis protein HemY [bacterium]